MTCVTLGRLSQSYDWLEMMSADFCPETRTDEAQMDIDSDCNDDDVQDLADEFIGVATLDTAQP